MKATFGPPISILMLLFNLRVNLAQFNDILCSINRLINSVIVLAIIDPDLNLPSYHTDPSDSICFIISTVHYFLPT